MLGSLPTDVQERARKAYALFSTDPQHPSLRFKRVHTTLPIHSVRVSGGYRAVGTIDGDVIVLFWVGSHADYDKLLKEV